MALSTHAIRVLQPVAGKNWGMQFMPRQGDEMVMGYLYGDARQPIVLGSLYNAKQLPFYPLPNAQNKTGIVTMSVGNSSIKHELTFDDTKGNEVLTFASGKDMALSSKKDFTINIAHDVTYTVKGKVERTIGKEQIIKAKQSMTFKAGSSSITISPDKISIQAMKVTAGAGGGSATGTSVSRPANASPATALHWIQGRYTDSNGAPITNLPYTINHSDGTTVKGNLDANGQTIKVQQLQSGTSTITFGNKAQLEAKLATQRQQLQTYLNTILSKASAQAAKDHAELQTESWWQKVYTYDNDLGNSIDQSAVGAVKAGANTVVALFEDAGKAIALAGRAGKDELTNNQVDLSQVKSQVNAKVGQILNNIQGDYDTLQTVFEDAATREMLEDFSKDYIKTASGLMLLQDVGNVIGGLGVGVILSVVSENPEALGVAMADVAGSDIVGAGTEIKQIEQTVTELQKCNEISDAEVDQVHEATAGVIAERKKLAKDFYLDQGYSNDDAIKHLKGIDFSKPVIVKTLPKGTILEQKQIPSSTQGDYYSMPGTPATNLGINPQARSVLDGQIYERAPQQYELTQDVQMLQSTASKILDNFSVSDQPYQTEGGALQYFSAQKNLFKPIN